MKICRSLILGFTIAYAPAAISGQELAVINNPVSSDTQKVQLTAAERNLMNRVVLPKVRKKLVSDICEEAFEPAGVIHGAFSRAGSEQTIVFYQFCQTGNGFGEVGLVLVENNKILGNYVADAGWSVDAKVLPDINQNGLDEFALYYSGGLHQGGGGTGADIMEFTPAGPKGLGWFQAESFGEGSGDFSYKVSAKTGKVPLFYREKYTSSSSGKFRKIGRQMPFKLGKQVSHFEAIK